MKLTGHVTSSSARHEVKLSTGDVTQLLSVPPKPDGAGSAINGGEFLMLALATCFCNDLYREAKRLGIPLDGLEVEATAE